eukprot:c8363_g1_i3.p1 GENE.c8363_g1_i3~~c8363_g1_i3.p1  ORF type:complete len:555 (+),score=121.54 c8363_g1_i3:33-1667(+)
MSDGPHNYEATPRRELFVSCSPRSQGAIVNLYRAIRVLKDDASDLDEVSTHIQGALESLLVSAGLQLSPRSSPSSPRGMNDLRDEVFEWLSASSTPNRPPVLARVDSVQFEFRHALDREMSFSEGSDRGAAKFELSRVMNWDEFDVFNLDRVTGGHALSTIAVHLFKHFNLINDLKLDQTKVKNYWQQIERGYQDVPYHSQVHAADVMQELAWFLNCPSVRAKLQPLELCAALVAAGIHDHDHPGVNNDFLIKTSHEHAMKYNDKSVLENHHAATGLAALHRVDDNNFLSHFDLERLLMFRQLVSSMVLATDMSFHFQLQDEFAKTFNLNLTSESSGPTTPRGRKFEMNTAKRQLLLEQLLHLADLSNSAKPFRFAKPWGERVVTEFFAQGDQELLRGLPQSAMTGRSPNALEKLQIAFIQHIVKPTLELTVQKVPEAQLLLQHAIDNIHNWHECMRESQHLQEHSQVQPQHPPQVQPQQPQPQPQLQPQPQPQHHVQYQQQHVQHHQQHHVHYQQQAPPSSPITAAAQRMAPPSPSPSRHHPQ